LIKELRMRDLSYRILGVPLGTRQQAELRETMVGQRTPEAAVDFLMDSIEHNTQKSGALLGAQGLFVAIDIFAVDRAWSNAMILPSLFLLLAGALIVMTNLRGALGVYRPGPSRTSTDHVTALFSLVLWRTLKFNIGLYSTFLSIALFAIAALGLRL
jgi:hypothetical protein